MMRKRMLILITLMFLVGLYGYGYWNKVHYSGWQFEGWKAFQQEMMDKNSSIEKTNIYGSSPSLHIGITVNEDIPISEIERLFLETRSFLFQKEVFPELVKHHQRKYKGTLDELYITIKYGSNYGDYYHSYYSIREPGSSLEIDSFRAWYIDMNGVLSEYVEKE